MSKFLCFDSQLILLIDSTLLVPNTVVRTFTITVFITLDWKLRASPQESVCLIFREAEQISIGETDSIISAWSRDKYHKREKKGKVTISRCEN